MGDNKIIKDLESCKSGKCANCGYCEYLGKDIINSKGLHVSCCHLLIADALDLINHQKAEIEKLTAHIQEGIDLAKQIPEMVAMAQAEAIKEKGV